MPKVIKINNSGAVEFPFDYKARYETIMGKMNMAIFNEFRTTLKEVQDFNAECLQKYKKPEPKLNVMLVSSTLNQFLRELVPEGLKSFRTLEPSEIQVGFVQFMKLITEINTLVVLLPDKTLFAAFMGFTTATYDALRQDTRFADVLDGVDDYLQHQILLGAKTGFMKESSSVAQLRIKDGIGHSLTTATDIPELPEEQKAFDYAAFLERKRLARSVMQIGEKSSKK